ncbi:MAG TPA: SRPBCC domain-containing protein [Steroidobacteraceae bacterium]|jgi:uncharacterized protein YndB with AHSA1/START domain
MATIWHEVWIEASAQMVYQTLSTAEGVSSWWDKQTAVQNGTGWVLESNPGPDHGVLKLKVLDLSKDKRIEWECISNHPKNSPASAWTGTHVIFEIARRSVPPWASNKSEMTILTFRHSHRDENSEYFGFCNFKWGEALQKLKRICE